MLGVYVQISLWMFVAVSLVGVVLLVRGLRVRRRGETLHCRRCDYELTGLAPVDAGARGRCPECGTELIAANIVHGERYRRRRAAVVGALVLLGGLLPLTGIAPRLWNEIDWYQLRPTGWLIDEVERAISSGTTPFRAKRELDRRQARGSLSASHRERLINLALTEQAKPKLGLLGRELIEFLGACEENGQLSEAQRKRFFEQMVRVSLRVRSPVAIGDQVPYQIGWEGRGPDTWRMEYQSDFEWEGRKERLAGASGFGSGGMATTLFIRAATRGRHRLTMDSQLRFFRRTDEDVENERTAEAAAPPLHEHTVTHTAVFEVLERMPDDAIRLIDDASLAAPIRAALTPTQFVHRNDGQGFVGEIEAIQPMSVGVAFDVFARLGENEYPIGSVYLQAGRSGAGFHVEALVPELAAVRQVDLILRSNPAVARQTVDMIQLWKGELIFTNVPVAPAR
jgi:hypothetical protein